MTDASPDMLNTLRLEIAEANGFELYKRYSEKVAASFLTIHPQTLKTKRLQGRISYVKIGNRNVGYFGFQIADFLIGSITWATPRNPLSRSATTGLAENRDETPGTDTGGTQTESAHAAHRLARATLKKPKND